MSESSRARTERQSDKIRGDDFAQAPQAEACNLNNAVQALAAITCRVVREFDPRLVVEGMLVPHVRQPAVWPESFRHTKSTSPRCREHPSP